MTFSEKRIRGVGSWLRERPWTVSSFAAGVLIGVVFCLPLVPYQLPDSTANILGAALGAIFAVWGAAWISDEKERRKNRLAVRAVSATVGPLIAQAEKYRDALVSAGSGDKARIREAYEHSQKFDVYLNAFRERVEFMTPMLLSLGGAGVVVHGTLLHSADSMKSAADLHWGAFYDEPDSRETGITSALHLIDSNGGRMQRAVEVLSLELS